MSKTDTDEVTHLRALLAEQTARAERAEAELAGVADAMHGPTIQPLVERVRGYVEACALFSAEKAEALAALAYAADRRGTQFDFDEWLPMVVAALGREPAPQPPHTNPRAEKAEAACAEMRAALEAVMPIAFPPTGGADGCGTVGGHQADALMRARDVLTELAPTCRCDEAWTSRGRHEVNAMCHMADDAKAAIADLDALLKKGGG